MGRTTLALSKVQSKMMSLQATLFKTLKIKAHLLKKVSNRKVVSHPKI